MIFQRLRQDEIDWFNRISDGKTILWMAGASYLWHATTNGEVAVCSSSVRVYRDLNPDRDQFPSTQDRSNDLMTCERCQGLVRRIKMPVPRGDLQ